MQLLPAGPLVRLALMASLASPAAAGSGSSAFLAASSTAGSSSGGGNGGDISASSAGNLVADWKFVRRGACCAGLLPGCDTNQLILPHCAAQCRNNPECEYFSFSFETKLCTLFGAVSGCPKGGEHPEQSSYRLLRTLAPVPAPAPVPAEPAPQPSPEPGRSACAGLAIAEQPGARIPVGGTARVFIVGSSNAMWQTWADQLHLLLEQLGYDSPLVKGTQSQNRTRPTWTAQCDDMQELSSVRTLRIAKPGWSSWGFAYDSMDDCNAEGFRNISGIPASCTNGWQCEERFVGTDALIRPSDIASLASGSEVTVLHNWVNDFSARFAGSRCFAAGEVPGMGDVSVTVDSLRRTIRAIHAASPGVTVAVMAKYPGAAGTVVGCDYEPLNRAVREGLEGEQNTVFVDYSFPRDEDMFLQTKSGHANCRGDKVMAAAVVDALFRAKVLARGLALSGDVEDSGAQACPAPGRAPCAELSAACCQRSALCWPSEEGRCLPYGTGESKL